MSKGEQSLVEFSTSPLETSPETWPRNKSFCFPCSLKTKLVSSSLAVFYTNRSDSSTQNTPGSTRPRPSRMLLQDQSRAPASILGDPGIPDRALRCLAYFSRC